MISALTVKPPEVLSYWSRIRSVAFCIVYWVKDGAGRKKGWTVRELAKL